MNYEELWALTIAISDAKNDLVSADDSLSGIFGVDDDEIKQYRIGLALRKVRTAVDALNLVKDF